LFPRFSPPNPEELTAVPPILQRPVISLERLQRVTG